MGEISKAWKMGDKRLGDFGMRMKDEIAFLKEKRKNLEDINKAQEKLDEAEEKLREDMKHIGKRISSTESELQRAIDELGKKRSSENCQWVGETYLRLSELIERKEMLDEQENALEEERETISKALLKELSRDP